MNEPDHSAYQQDFSDYYDGSLPPERSRTIREHLDGCQVCRDEYERFRQALGALSGLHKMAAPQDFGEQVTGTISRRSGGRFFGRKAFGDRVPFELIAVVGLLIVAALVLLLRWSVTGPVHEPLQPTQRPPQVAPGTEVLVPRP